MVKNEEKLLTVKEYAVENHVASRSIRTPKRAE